ncbi:MAG TPA: hypothetical protein VFW87_12595, partial [Pirellulales bacterium]|nr:hypothetical protein [Pirellulales bacterium]
VALESGRAVVVVTHDSRVFSFGDRIARMEDGRVTEVEHQTAAAAERLQAMETFEQVASGS